MRFMCSVCRREREQVCHRLRLQCCGDVFVVCQEYCAEIILHGSGGRQTVEMYVDLYERVHKAVCRKMFEM